MNADLFTLTGVGVALGQREVLDIPRLSLPEGKVVAVTGPNGSGKTTLLHLLSALAKPDRGSVSFRGRELSGIDDAASIEIRRRFGVVLQSPYLFKANVRRNVSYGLSCRGIPRPDRHREAERALDLVGLRGFGDRYHTALSGGEAQRVALARALVLKPGVLLLDEPFANIDAVSRTIIERVLHAQNREEGTSIVFTTHDLDQAFRMADIVVTLFDGRVHEGSMENVFHGSIQRRDGRRFFETGRLSIALPEGSEDARTAAIPPETIILSLEPSRTSALNILRGRITGVRERGGSVDVLVDAGETLTSRVTSESYGKLELRLGKEVSLIFKAESVKLY